MRVGMVDELKYILVGGTHFSNLSSNSQTLFWIMLPLTLILSVISPTKSAPSMSLSYNCIQKTLQKGRAKKSKTLGNFAKFQIVAWFFDIIFLRQEFVQYTSTLTSSTSLTRASCHSNVLFQTGSNVFFFTSETFVTYSTGRKNFFVRGHFFFFRIHAQIHISIFIHNKEKISHSFVIMQIDNQSSSQSTYVHACSVVYTHDPDPENSIWINIYSCIWIDILRTKLASRCLPPPPFSAPPLIPASKESRPSCPGVTGPIGDDLGCRSLNNMWTVSKTRKNKGK